MCSQGSPPKGLDLAALSEQYPRPLGPRVGVGERVDQARGRGAGFAVDVAVSDEGRAIFVGVLLG